MNPITYLLRRRRRARKLTALIFGLYLVLHSPREVAHFERPAIAQDKFHFRIQVVDKENRGQKTYPLPQVFFVEGVIHGLKTMNECQAHTLNV